VFDGLGLIGGFDGVELIAKADSLLALSSDLAVQAGAERVFAGKCIRSFGGLALGRNEKRLGVRDLSRQGESCLIKEGPLQLDRLQLYQVFNLLLHPLYEVYGIYHVLRKWILLDFAKIERD
jgi:hypothetical protein